MDRRGFETQFQFVEFGAPVAHSPASISRRRTKARTTKTLISTARSELSTVAA